MVFWIIESLLQYKVYSSNITNNIHKFNIFKYLDKKMLRERILRENNVDIKGERGDDGPSGMPGPQGPMVNY